MPLIADCCTLIEDGMQRELRPRFQFKSKENRKMLANAAFLLLIVKCPNAMDSESACLLRGMKNGFLT